MSRLESWMRTDRDPKVHEVIGLGAYNLIKLDDRIF